MRIEKSTIWFFIIALLIPFINRAYIYIPDYKIDLFIFREIEQALSYYIYDNAKSLIIVLFGFSVWYFLKKGNKNEYFIAKMGLTIALYFCIDIISYFLFRETVSTTKWFLFYGCNFGWFQVYYVDVILFFLWWFFWDEIKNFILRLWTIVVQYIKNLF